MILPELGETRAIMGLSQSQLADLFRIRQSSLAEWRTRDVPMTRRAPVERLAELVR